MMENKSRHYGDVHNWVIKVINSCETYPQTLTAKSLIFNFEKQMRRNNVDSNLSTIATLANCELLRNR